MKVIITGGAGFIGSNAAARYLRRGDEVVVLDNLRRAGAVKNLEWLQSQGTLTFANIDIRDAQRVGLLFQAHRNARLILHLAGQVAVTTSLANPRADFEVNALGTLNILEAVRQSRIDAPLLFSSTNKVYGNMEELRIVERNGRYGYADLPNGVSEGQNLDFHSPYGCSRGAADQYVRDYHRIYGLRTVVLRQSCIYGPRQWGTEDQGWVAWFMMRAQAGRPITLYGDGKQVRDLLFIDDLLEAYDCAVANIETAVGRVYNLGGGPGNALSLRELLAYLEERCDRPLRCRRKDSRPGDQRVYISDVSRAQQELGWRPRTKLRKGLDLLYDWIASQRRLFDDRAASRLTGAEAQSLRSAK